jgi:hypothetical protein
VPGVTVAVHDTPENILERITFYDIDSRRIDKHLTGEERILYLKEIKADISYSSGPMSGRTCRSPSLAWTRRPAPQPSAPGWTVPERASNAASPKARFATVVRMPPPFSRRTKKKKKELRRSPAADGAARAHRDVVPSATTPEPWNG